MSHRWWSFDCQPLTIYKMNIMNQIHHSHLFNITSIHSIQIIKYTCTLFTSITSIQPHTYSSTNNIHIPSHSSQSLLANSFKQSQSLDNVLPSMQVTIDAVTSVARANRREQFPDISWLRVKCCVSCMKNDKIDVTDWWQRDHPIANVGEEKGDDELRDWWFVACSMQ